MEKRLYHGSAVPDISALEPRSRLHGTEQRVVYLTDCAPYALLYIWDSERHGGAGKHVTGWVADGVAHYEEQFLDQLRTLYQGAAGYLYAVRASDAVKAMPERPNLYFSEEAVPAADAEFIPDVYARLLAYERAGQLVVRRFEEQTEARQKELTAMMAEAIVRSGFFAADDAQRAFMQRHFSAAWTMAEQHRVQVQRVMPGSGLWEQLIVYADSCPWVAGKHLADMLRENRLQAWESAFAAVQDGEIIGFCTLLETDYYPENRYSPWISTMFVDEGHRGRRISGQMIETAIRYAKSQAFSRVYIPSDITGLYEKYGFVKIDELVNYAGDTDSIFARDI